MLRRADSTHLCVLVLTFRWPTLDEFDALYKEFNVPNHWHVLRPGDMYIIRRGVFHMFLNSTGITMSLAADAVYPFSSHPWAHGRS